MIDTIPRSALQQHIAVLGKTGSGKTYAVRGVVEQLLDRKERVCIIDPTGAWHGLRSSSSGKSAGFPVVIFGGAHADLPLSGTHGETLAEAIGTSSTPAIIDTSLMRVGERTRFFADFADALVRKNKGPLHLVIDEAHLFAPQGKVNDPQSGAMLHAANNLVSLGRSRGLRIILITQRPAKLHKDSLTQVETLIAMRLIAPQDRKAVEEWIKDNADQAKGREILASLATLKTGQGWIWAPELDVLERISFPKIKTFDSGRAPDGTETAGQVLAPIDREAIGEKLKVLAADALANDPAALKRELATVKRELAQMKSAKGAPSIDIEDLEAAERRGYERASKEWRGKSADQGRRVSKAIMDGVKEISIKLEREILVILTESISRPVMNPPAKAEAGNRDHRLRASPIERPRAEEYRGTVTRSEARPATATGISASQQKILNQLAWLQTFGLYPAPKETLAAVCKVSPTSGGYFNNLGRLRSLGAIEYPQPGTVAFTPAGQAAAVATDEDGREIHEYWLEILPAPQRAIVEALLKNHPDELSKDQLASRINVSATSGGYFNNLGRLRTLGAIDYPRPGFVQLTKYVMP